MEKYFVGLDIGTNSCGFCVSDENYNIISKNGKNLWGVRFFDEAKKADKRRIQRGNRRRVQRRKERIDLLQDIFREEINKVDNKFFLRLENSAFYLEDKKVEDKYSLFDDKNFNDKQFYKKFKTIYHLRRDLMNKDIEDIRHLYLGIHHIIKYRGHFVKEGQVFSNESALKENFELLNEYCSEQEYNSYFDIQECDKIKKTIIEEKGIKNLQKILGDILKPTKQGKEFITAIVGGSVTLKNLFASEQTFEIEKFKFSSADFEEKVSLDLMTLLGDDYKLIEILKNIYDNFELFKLLKNNETLSDAMVEFFEEHHKDLEMLKHLLKDYGNKEIYKDMFKTTDSKINNYVAYVGMNKVKDKKINTKKCKQEDFYKYVKSVLSKDNFKDLVETKIILDKIEAKTFLQKQRSSENSVIPYQINLMELNKILKNAENKFDFLNKVEDGITIKEKIVSLLTFKIPYFVGPLSPNSSHSWIQKRYDEKILPWNYKRVIDLNASEEKFIQRMTLKCTYVKDENVLPFESIFYQKYMILNEINKLKINGNPISIDQKKKLFELFKIEKNVTNKKIEGFLKKENLIENNSVIELPEERKTSYPSFSSYIIFSKVFGNVEEHIDEIEDIIFWGSILTDSERLVNRFIEKYPKYNSETNILKQIKGLKFSKFAPFSKKFLLNVLSTDKETAETGMSILDCLYETNFNLQELLFSPRFDFVDKINNLNEKKQENFDKITYNDVDDLFISPAVKRGTWQAVQIVQELTKIMKNKPEKIFVEVTRENSQDKSTPPSRKKQIEKMYAESKLNKDELSKLYEDLTLVSDSQMRSKKYFLYFLQLGRCVYTGKQIDLEEIAYNSSYDIDHIIPQSDKKDDSVDNMVLCTRQSNEDKKDIYPINSQIQANMKDFWKKLCDAKLMSKEKYNRLIRKDNLTNEELAGFVNRQLVETNQTAKAVIELLRQCYGDNKIVYSKAGNVTDFRQKYDLLKCRDINDMHHAHDAYLNIVVGNILNKRFGIKVSLLKENNDLTNIFDKIFESNIKNAWDKNTSIITVKTNLEKTNMLFSQMPMTNESNFYKETIWPHTEKNLLPLKQNGPLSDTLKYGGYSSLSTCYFSLVEYKDAKEKVFKRIIPIPYYYLKVFGKDKNKLLNYIKDELSSKNLPNIIIEKIHIKSELQINNSRVLLTGTTGNQLIVTNFNQFFVNKKDREYIRAFLKHLNKEVSNFVDENGNFATNENVKRQNVRKNRLVILSKEENLKIYDMFVKQMTKPIYNGFSAFVGYVQFAKDNRNVFENLTLKDQFLVLKEFLNLFSCNAVLANLELINGSVNTGKLQMAQNLKPNISLVSKSITGYYEKIRKLS